MNTLPTEIASSIASHVDHGDFYSLSLVNQQCYKVTNPLLWRTVCISNARKLLKFYQGTLLSKGHVLKHIRSVIIEVPMDDTTLLAFISHLPPSLEQLELSNARHITDESLEHLPSQCPQLKSLTINYATITDVTMVSLGHHCHRLRSLTLHSLDLFSPNLLTALAACPLENICINWSYAGQWMADEAARQVARDLATFSHLKALVLTHKDEVLNRHLLAVMDRNGNQPWPHLTVCRLDGCLAMKEQDAIRFIEAHPHLTELVFISNEFSDDLLYTIADTLPHLTYLDVSRCWDFTHHGAREIILKCPLLTSFNLDFPQSRRSDLPELGPYSDKCFAMFSCHLELLEIDPWENMNIIHLEMTRRRVPDQNNSTDANVSDE